MHKISPHLWFDKEAKEAAELYTSLFEDSRIVSVRTLRDTPSGDCDVVSFELAGQPFQAISAGWDVCSPCPARIPSITWPATAKRSFA